VGARHGRDRCDDKQHKAPKFLRQLVITGADDNIDSQQKEI
jgi:hypothetical protein